MRISSASMIAGGLSFVLVCAGCGSMALRPADEVVNQARAAVAAAEQADAKHFSPNQLQQAQDALAIAQDAAAGRESERAVRFAEKARLYACAAQAEAERKRAEDNYHAAAQALEQIRSQVAQAEQAAGVPVGATPSAQALPAAAAKPTPAVTPAVQNTPGARP